MIPRLPPHIATQARTLSRTRELQLPKISERTYQLPSRGPNPAGAQFFGRPFYLNAGQSLELMPADSNRRYLLVQNNADLILPAPPLPVNLFIHFNAASGLDKMRIRAGGYYEAIEVVPTTSINVTADGYLVGYVVEA